MKLFSVPQKSKGVVFDVDDTTYQHSNYFKRHTFQMDCAALADLWCMTIDEVSVLLTQKNGHLRTERRVNKVTMRDTITACDVDDAWLSEARARLWQPQDYLTRYPWLQESMRVLVERGIKVGFASTSHTAVVGKILAHLGLLEFATSALGMEYGLKPSPAIYQRVVESFGLLPNQCVSVGDSLECDCIPAISLGMGAVHVSGPTEVVTFTQMLVR